MREKLVNKRKKMNLTQEEVSKQLEITRAYYSHIETGTRNPTLKLAKKIADFYEEDVDTLFFNHNSNKTYRKDRRLA